VKAKLTSKFANMIQTAPIPPQFIGLILHLRPILQRKVGVGKGMIALDADVEENHSGFLSFRLVLEEHGAGEGSGLSHGGVNSSLTRHFHTGDTSGWSEPI